MESIDSGRFAFPVSAAARDERLSPGTKVLAIKIGDEARAFPLDPVQALVYSGVIHGEPYVVFSVPDGPSGGAFSTMANGQELSFIVQDGSFVHEQTSSTWDLAGRARTGPLAGVRLTALPSKTTFWFALVAAEPEIRVAVPR